MAVGKTSNNPLVEFGTHKYAASEFGKPTGFYAENKVTVNTDRKVSERTTETGKKSVGFFQSIKNFFAEVKINSERRSVEKAAQKVVNTMVTLTTATRNFNVKDMVDSMRTVLADGRKHGNLMEAFEKAAGKLKGSKLEAVGTMDDGLGKGLKALSDYVNGYTEVNKKGEEINKGMEIDLMSHVNETYGGMGGLNNVVLGESDKQLISEAKRYVQLLQQALTPHG